MVIQISNTIIKINPPPPLSRIRSAKQPIGDEQLVDGEHVMRGEDVGGAVQRPVRPVRQRLEEGIQRRNLLRRLRIRDPSRNLSTNKTRLHHSNCPYDAHKIYNAPPGTRVLP